MSLDQLFAWLQATRIATTIGGSSLLIGFISSVHLLGLTLIVGSALVSNLRLLGVLLVERPVPEVTATARYTIVTGLLISVTTGLLLFAPKALMDAENKTFQLKMAILAAAVLCHITLFRRVSRSRSVPVPLLRFTGGLGLILWCGVACAGCVFILFE